MPDEPVCAEITPIKGWCTWTVSEKEQFVDDVNKLYGMTWWEMRPMFVLVPPTTYEKFKTSFIKMCKKNGNCNKDIDKWERKMNSVGKGKK